MVSVKFVLVDELTWLRNQGKVPPAELEKATVSDVNPANGFASILEQVCFIHN
jgi:hypothetical protein